MSAPAPSWKTWAWRGFYAFLAMAACVAIWQRTQIARFPDIAAEETPVRPVPQERTNSAPPPTTRNAAEVRAEILAIQLPEVYDVNTWQRTSLQARRLLRSVPTDALITELKAGHATDGNGMFASNALVELASRDPLKALGLALEIDAELEKQGTDRDPYPANTLAIIQSLAVRDPQGARKWLEEHRGSEYWPKSNAHLIEGSIDNAIFIEEMHRDPLAAITREHGEIDEYLRQERWQNFADCVGPEHWAGIAELAAGARKRKGTGGAPSLRNGGSGLYGIVASSMLHRLGFDEAWARADMLGLSEATALDLSVQLVAAEPGPATPQRAASLLEKLPGETHPRLISEIASAWAGSDGVAAAAWLASFGNDETRQALESMVKSTSSSDPQKAAQMALQVTDQSQRAELLEHVLERWSKSDPLAAEFFKRLLSTGSSTTYEYDSENQLVSIIDPGIGTTRYYHDGLGRRIRKDSKGVSTTYIYDGIQILSQYIDDANAAT